MSSVPAARTRGSAGMASIELVLMTPVLFLALGFVIVAGRLGTVQGQIAAASRDAARAASMAPTFDQAVTAATTTASASLAANHLTCGALVVDVADPATFHAGGTVTVTVRCQVKLSDVAVPGLPFTRDVARSSVEVIDLYRGGG